MWVEAGRLEASIWSHSQDIRRCIALSKRSRVVVSPYEHLFLEDFLFFSILKKLSYIIFKQASVAQLGRASVWYTEGSVVQVHPEASSKGGSMDFATGLAIGTAMDNPALGLALGLSRQMMEDEEEDDRHPEEEERYKLYDN